MDNGRRDRARGCLLGQLSGDALGSMVEFESGAAIRRRYPGGLRLIGPSAVWGTLAGQPTDDSEMALILARTLIQSGRYDEEAVAGAYLFWYHSGPFDIGGTIASALRALRSARPAGESPTDRVAVAGNRTSEANGALMRQSPLAIWGHDLDPDVLAAAVGIDTALTHPNAVCSAAGTAHAVALAAVIRDGLDAENAYQIALRWNREHGNNEKVNGALERARASRPAFETHQGHVLVALQNAWYQALHAGTVEDGVVDTVMGGGDTDTNGAIAGALLGALHGIDAVPGEWRETVLTCRPEVGRPNVRRPRPSEFWPVDALDLADQLLTAAR